MPHPSAKVLIIGAGIAGPVLAIFLKLKGYDPVVYERTQDATVAGLRLCLQPNGLKVLAKAPGLLEAIKGQGIDHFVFYSVVPEDKGVLAMSDIPTKLREHYGLGLLGVSRPVFHNTLLDAAEKLGIPVKFGHKVVDIEQTDESVTVKFEEGGEDTGSFAIGCDGLHSNTRICLFGSEKAEFTGLVQTGGVCRIPDSLKNEASMMNVFGDGAYMISYPIDETHLSWATTAREPEAKENWRAMPENAAEEFRKTTVFAGWDYGAGDIVRSTEKIIKYGLYDRPALTSWHKGRVCLLGDAAHPTSPHLGQGANQAFEDVDLLIELLEMHNPSAEPPSKEILETIFTEYEDARISRSAELVKAAREQGESRVVSGVEGSLKRNAAYRQIWKDEESVIKYIKHTYEK